MIYNLLFEDNKDIDSLIDHLNSKIVELRKTKILKEEDDLFRNLKLIYEESINPWMKDYFLLDKELSKEDEQELIDLILDAISTINKIINGN